MNPGHLLNAGNWKQEQKGNKNRSSKIHLRTILSLDRFHILHFTLSICPPFKASQTESYEL